MVHGALQCCGGDVRCYTMLYSVVTELYPVVMVRLCVVGKNKDLCGDRMVLHIIVEMITSTVVLLMYSDVQCGMVFW